MPQSLFSIDQRGQAKVVTVVLFVGLVTGASAVALEGASTFAEDATDSLEADASLEIVEVVEPGETEPSSIVVTIQSVGEDVDAIEIEALETGNTQTITDPVAGDAVQFPEENELNGGEEITATAVTEETTEIIDRHTLNEDPETETVTDPVDGAGGGISSPNINPEAESEGGEEE